MNTNFYVKGTIFHGIAQGLHKAISLFQVISEWKYIQNNKIIKSSQFNLKPMTIFQMNYVISLFANFKADFQFDILLKSSGK